METAIRNALERAGIPGAEQRSRIYQSARTALERSLERQGITDSGIISDQRERLDALIAGIETEWAPPGTPGSQADRPAQAPTSAPPPVQSHSPATVQATDFPSPPSRAAEPSGLDPAARRAAPDVAGDAAPRMRQPVPEPSLDVNHPGARPTPAQSAPPVSDAPLKPRDSGDGRLDFTPVSPAIGQPRQASPVAPEARPIPDKSKRVKVAKDRSKRRKRPVFSAVFSGVVMLSFIGIGIWFAVESGAFKSAAERDTSVPNPPPTVSDEDFAGNGGALRQLEPGAGFSGEWTNVYTPGDGASISTRGSATADVVTDGASPALRISSQSADQNGEVLIPLGADVLQALAGRKSVLALTVRSASNDATQIYVKCEFSTLGGCGRRRFDVTYETTDILFNLDYDRALAPSTPGNLVINSDISGGGHSIDLLAVRMRAGG